jgi:hypothetical protein
MRILCGFNASKLRIAYSINCPLHLREKLYSISERLGLDKIDMFHYGISF